MGIGFAEGKELRLDHIHDRCQSFGYRSSRMCCAGGGHGMCAPLSGNASLRSLFQADCVFPTRTARFGVALTFNGPLNLSKSAQHVHHSLVDCILKG